MKALTLWPEWAFAVWKLGKNGENRTWSFPEWLIGQPLAIHAGVRPIAGVKAGERADEIEAFMDACRVIGTPDGYTLRDANAIRGHIVAIVWPGFSTKHSPSKWAAADGQWFNPFVRQEPLKTPIRCTGAQGLWTVPVDVERQIKEQIGC